MKNITIRHFLIYLTISLFVFNCSNDDDDQENSQNDGSSFLRMDINNDGMYESHEAFEYYNGYNITSTSTSSTYQTSRSHTIVFSDGEITIENGELKYANNTTFVVEYKIRFYGYGDPRIIESGDYESINSSHNISYCNVKTNVIVSNGNITSSDTINDSSNDLYFNILVNSDYYEINFGKLPGNTPNPFWGEYNGSLTTLER
ncbi:hypothetical protein KO494_14075 [Lacinutrix sp. C3R15]|uniref:hypothetical protein n=1 Tax=Flavobacteriaceae TaxID=49546 RepID=UPI001C09246A|nr:MULTISPECIES: hypothetical protein [Flavobacteriaceae]MBU2940671.1 hypothetical protein [Lacinutrix sp. C3R15]MDO6623989.1 hypothetical protein [Oceanihabitans sp. 1_MG-2023]